MNQETKVRIDREAENVFARIPSEYERSLSVSRFIQGAIYEHQIAETEQRKLISHLENWCGCSAYGENHPCDEHNCDDSRGRNCSADELLDEIKKYLSEQ